MVKFEGEGLVAKVKQYLGFRRVNNKDNHVVIEIALRKSKEQFEMILQTLVLCKNGRVEDSKNLKVLRDIHNEQINACMSSCNHGRATIMVGPSL